MTRWKQENLLCSKALSNQNLQGYQSYQEQLPPSLCPNRWQTISAVQSATSVFIQQNNILTQQNKTTNSNPEHNQL